MDSSKFNLLVENSYEYFMRHGVGPSDLRKVEEIYSNNRICVLGFSGALGESLSIVFSICKVTPSELVLVGRKDSASDCWNHYIRNTNIQNVKFMDPDEALESYRDSIVFYFLGYAQPAKFMSDPESLIKINGQYLLRLLDKNPRNLIYSSTSEIYSGHDQVCNEYANLVIKPSHPRGIYVYSKLLGESIIGASNVDSLQCRISLATPPYWSMHDQRLLSDLVRKALKLGEVKLSGGAEYLRAYQYGPFMMLKICLIQFSGHNLFNVSGGEEISIFDMGRVVASRFGVPFVCSDEKDQSGSPPVVRVDSEKLKNKIGVFKQESFKEVVEAFTYSLGKLQ